jgi:anti-sigma B factor antagonist
VAAENVDSARITRLPSEIDVASCGAAEAGLLAAVSAPGLVIADMTGTAICDSAGMRMLLGAHNRARSSGATLRVAVTPGTSVARVMAILGLNRILFVYDSVEDARAARAARLLPPARRPPRPPWPVVMHGPAARPR